MNTRRLIDKQSKATFARPMAVADLPFFCSVCSKPFQTVVARKRHFDQFHVNVPHYVCWCGKTFVNSTNRSINEHKGMCKRTCPLCYSYQVKTGTTSKGNNLMVRLHAERIDKLPEQLKTLTVCQYENFKQHFKWCAGKLTKLEMESRIQRSPELLMYVNYLLGEEFKYKLSSLERSQMKGSKRSCDDAPRKVKRFKLTTASSYQRSLSSKPK